MHILPFQCGASASGWGIAPASNFYAAIASNWSIVRDCCVTGPRAADTTGISMFAYILRRLWQMLPTMAGVVVLVFVLFNWVGGDPSYLLAGKMADAHAIASIRAQLGLDQPWFVQLGIFVRQILTFDFGNAWSTGEPVSHILATRLGPSLTVLVPLTVLETLLGVALALAVAFVRGSLTDRLVMVACT